MKILSLKLCGYIRLSLSNIQYFELNPNDRLQLILGTNGSGKSSVLKELTPLPAIANEYTKDGYKVIDISHNNSLYTLKSIFSSAGNKFNFIKDNEELNPGGTISIYRELVKREFNITQEIHELLTGVISFHSMSIADRRNWFTRISDADYTYAIQYFQRLKEQLRDIQGAVKLNQSRLVQESEKLLNQEEESIYRTEIEDLNKLIRQLLELKTPITNNSQVILQNINQYELQLKQLSETLISYRKQFLNFELFDSIEQIDLTILDKQAYVNSLNMNIDSICLDIEKDQHTLDALQKANVDSFSDIDLIILDLHKQHIELSERIKLNINSSDPKHAYQAIMALQEQLTDICSSVQCDSRISRDNYISTLEQHQRLTQSISTLDNKQLQLLNKKKELEHFRQHNQLECPNCSYIWYKGYDENVYQHTLAVIEAIAKKLIEENDLLKVIEIKIQKAKEFLELQKSFTSLINNWSILKTFWDHILNLELFYSNPRQILNLIEDYKQDLQIQIQILDIEKNISDKQDLKALMSKNQELDLAKLKDRITDLNHKLYRANNQIKVTKSYLSKLHDYRKITLKIRDIETNIDNLLINYDNKSKELLDVYKREALNETINIVQLELNKKEQIISKIDIQKALVSNLESQITQLNDRAELLKIAIKELSPTEGLIAKGLTGFINHFVFLINSFIKRIWSYPLELIPIVPDDNLDLDYKFSVRINDSFNISDINKGSTAMRQIIDLAFKLTSMHYLNITDAPVYLDEIGSNMDHAHKNAIFKTIESLVANSNYSQIFLISHYENSYGCLKNADVTVLCSNNIVLPKDIVCNKHTIIK